jgi:sec-independent protein translocase protein TatA
MGLPNIGPLELIIVLAVLLLIVGPRRLPEMGQAVGRTIREFRKASSEITDVTNVTGEPKPGSAAPVVPPALPVPPGAATMPTPPPAAVTPPPIVEPDAAAALTTPISPADSQAPAPAGTDGTPDASRPS